MDIQPATDEQIAVWGSEIAQVVFADKRTQALIARIRQEQARADQLAAQVERLTTDKQAMWDDRERFRDEVQRLTIERDNLASQVDYVRPVQWSPLDIKRLNGPEPRCETCRWWEANGDGLMIAGYEAHRDCMVRFESRSMVAVESDCGPFCMTYTAPDFGCILHEPKETT